MRLRSHRGNLVVWSSSAVPAGRGTRPGRVRQIRWWLRTGGLLTVIGVQWLARTLRSRWEPVTLSAGGLLTVAGFMLPAGMAFFPGLLILIVALLKGIASNGRSAVQSADCRRWHG